MKRQNRFLVIATMVIGIVALFSSSIFAKDLEFVLISKYVHPWFDVGNEGFKKAAAEIGGIKTRYLQPLTAEGKDQVKMMEDVIAEKPDGIAIAVNAPEALLPIINEAMKNQKIAPIAVEAIFPVPTKIKPRILFTKS